VESSDFFSVKIIFDAGVERVNSCKFLLKNPLTALIPSLLPYVAPLNRKKDAFWKKSLHFRSFLLAVEQLSMPDSS
jgi:hypothetical protein